MVRLNAACAASGRRPPMFAQRKRPGSNAIASDHPCAVQRHPAARRATPPPVQRHQRPGSYQCAMTRPSRLLGHRSTARHGERGGGAFGNIFIGLGDSEVSFARRAPAQQLHSHPRPWRRQPAVLPHRRHRDTGVLRKRKETPSPAPSTPSLAPGMVFSTAPSKQYWPTAALTEQCRRQDLQDFRPRGTLQGSYPLL